MKRAKHSALACSWRLVAGDHLGWLAIPGCFMRCVFWDEAGNIVIVEHHDWMVSTYWLRSVVEIE